MLSSMFTNPVMLAAMAAVLIPPIIEWLLRRRRQEVDLPTIRFLLQRKEQEKIKWQDRALLFLRMFSIFLLVAALARPLILRGLAGGRARNVILLVDGTASTHQTVGMTTGFRLTQKRAAATIRKLPEASSAPP